MAIIINIADLNKTELDIEQLAEDFMAQNNIGGVAEPLVRSIAIDVLKFGFQKLNEKLAPKG